MRPWSLFMALVFAGTTSQAPPAPCRSLVKDASHSLAVRLPDRSSSLEAGPSIGHARWMFPVAGPANASAAGAHMAQRLASGRREPSLTFEQAGGVLHSGGAYVTRFEQTFSSVIWHERYTQVSRQRRQFASSGGTFSAVSARRVLESELFLTWIPQDASWIAVRDVIAVDGTARPAGERRLQRLLSGPTVSSGQLRQLATENGRFNIGQIVHTFNEPTLALLFLDEHYRARFAFGSGEPQVIRGRRVLAHTFVERRRPSVIQDGDRDVPATGTIWIEPATGQVLQTSLELSGATGRLHGQMTVEYGPHPKFDVLIPMEMREVYSSVSGEEITTTATYSDFRRFETGARLVHVQ